MPHSYPSLEVNLNEGENGGPQDDNDDDGGGNVPGQFPQRQLFAAVKASNWEDAFMLISVWATDFQDFTRPEAMPPGNMHKGWTILQYACYMDDKDLAAQTVQRIFQLGITHPHSAADLDEFVNYADASGQTALHFAISKGHQQVVEDLIYHSADINMLGQVKRKDALRLIYDRLHKVLIRLFDGGLTVTKSKQDPSNELCWSLECDFTSITGVSSARDRKNADLLETRLLTTVLTQEKFKRTDILLHPLVQIFLHLKGQRFQGLILLSVLYKIFWLVLNIIFIASHTTWLNGLTRRNSGSGSEGNCSQGRTGFHYSSYLSTDQNMGHPVLTFSLGVATYLLTLLVALYEGKTTPDLTFHWSKFENEGLLVLLVALPLAYFLPVIFYSQGIQSLWTDAIFKAVNFIALITSLLLIQAVTTKLPNAGIYSDLLMKTFKRFLQVFVAFFPTLIAFMITFYLLLPERQQFDFFSGYAFSKLITMIVGELTYDEIFHDENNAPCSPHPLNTRLVFLLFVVFVVILLQNLLIGLTVGDVKELWQECSANHLATRLETIFLLENVLLNSPLFQVLTFLRAEQVVNSFLLSPVSIGGDKRGTISKQPCVVEIKMITLPMELQEAIKSKYQSS